MVFFKQRVCLFSIRKQKKRWCKKTRNSLYAQVLHGYCMYEKDIWGPFRLVRKVKKKKFFFGRSAKISASRDPYILVIRFEKMRNFTKMAIFLQVKLPTSKKLFFSKGLLGYLNPCKYHYHTIFTHKMVTEKSQVMKIAFFLYKGFKLISL